MRWRRRSSARCCSDSRRRCDSRVRAGDALKEGGRTVAGSPHQRLRRVLVARRCALAFVLVVSSGLLLRSFVVDGHTESGISARQAQ